MAWDVKFGHTIGMFFFAVNSWIEKDQRGQKKTIRGKKTKKDKRRKKDKNTKKTRKDVETCRGDLKFDHP